MTVDGEKRPCVEILNILSIVSRQHKINTMSTAPAMVM